MEDVLSLDIWRHIYPDGVKYWVIWLYEILKKQQQLVTIVVI